MIFVTGGTGLLGSHILMKLIQEGKNFQALRRRTSSLVICKKVFQYYNLSDKFQKINWVEGDILDIVSIEEHIKQCKYVIHAAALLSFHGKRDKKLLEKINIEGTQNIVNASLACNIKKLAYVSSIAALGRNSTNEMVDEECYFIHTKLDSQYSVSKYYAEQEVWRGGQEGLDIIIVNPSVILGPGDWSKGSSQMFDRVFKGLKFYTTGSTGYVDVIDVAKVVILLLNSKIKNERFIVNAENLKYRYFFNQIAKQFNKPEAKIRVTYFLKELAWRAEAIKSFFTGKKSLITKETANTSMTSKSYSSKKLQEKTGFVFTPISNSIERYCNWYISELS
ncbi:MAG: NAD-dependent epimerase/dehydratase family protein [Bacteroidota bacterium]|nr:NAD-dependent epimerase/dehydratase family protein [Bacteroidota bacterium]